MLSRVPPFLLGIDCKGFIMNKLIQQIEKGKPFRRRSHVTFI